MKKSLLTIVALGAMLGSCSNDETLDMTARQAITFDDVFVENSTRAIDNSYTSAGLSQFEVYGIITNSSNQTANLFEKELVEKKNNNQWVYDQAHTQYWIPGNTYNFTAIADGNIEGITQVETDANGMPTKIHLNDASKQKDILYATKNNMGYTSGEQKVGFIFDHLLAKVKFTVENIMHTDNGYTYMVKTIHIADAKSTATYDIKTKEWNKKDESYKLSFGNIVSIPIASTNDPNKGANATHIKKGDKYSSNFERLIIPQADMKISFSKELYKDNVLVQSEQETITMEGLEIKPGNAYNFVIKLGNPGAPIQFTVENINEWVTDTDNNVNVNN